MRRILATARGGGRVRSFLQQRWNTDINTNKDMEAQFQWKTRWDTVQNKIKERLDLLNHANLTANIAQIQWFPGHMYKASKQMEEMLQQSAVSLVLEIRDSRVRI